MLFAFFLSLIDFSLFSYSLLHSSSSIHLSSTTLCPSSSFTFSAPSLSLTHHLLSPPLFSSLPFPLSLPSRSSLPFLSASSYHNFLAHHLILSLSLILSILSYPIQSYPTASSLSFLLFSVLSSSYFFFNLLASYHPPSSFPPPLLSPPLLFLTLLISSCSMSSHLI